MIRMLLIVVLLAAAMFAPLKWGEHSIRVGCKTFTESIILGEVLVGLSEAAGEQASLRQMGGTRVLFDNLVGGEIDIYPEYTGTISKEIFSKQSIESQQELIDELGKRGIAMSEPLGFENKYAIAVTPETAQRLDLQKISDLRRHPSLRAGFSNEFMARSDGWPNLKKRYRLPQTDAKGMNHDLAYLQLVNGGLDIIDVYITDAKIAMLNLVLLEDDQHFFPRYDAVLIYRKEFAKQHPQVIKKMQSLEGRIDEETIKVLNGRVVRQDATDTETANAFLKSEFNIVRSTDEPSTTMYIIRLTAEHLDLVRKSLIPAILFSIPLGVVAAKWRRSSGIVLGAVSVVQTIPSLALLALLIAPVLYLGLSSSVTAIVALFLYSLLPIVRNTFTGIRSIPPSQQESAQALGLSPWYRLTQIELPLSSPTILAGIKTAAVLNVGFAALGALIGAGGYGQPILTGIRLNDVPLILQGALPAAGLALFTQWSFDFAERYIVPAGLRVKPST